MVGVFKSKEGKKNNKKKTHKSFTHFSLRGKKKNENKKRNETNNQRTPLKSVIAMP